MVEKRHASEEAKAEEKPEIEAKPEVKQEKMEGRRTEERRRPETSSGTNPPSIEGYRPERERKARKDDNVVFVGKKPTMSYVLAVITQFSDGNNEVFVKARGRSISTAIDVVEVVKKKFMQDLKCEIETDTEVITDERNQKINVSTVNARLFK